MSNTYWYFHNVFCSFLSFLSFPSCTIINNTKVNECFIWDSKKLVCHFGILVVVPECYSSHGWTKVDVELDVCICIDGVPFHFALSCKLHFRLPWSKLFNKWCISVTTWCFTFKLSNCCNLPLNCCLIILILLFRKSVWTFFNKRWWSSHHW